MTSALRWGWVVSTTARPLYPREISGTHCTGGWVDPIYHTTMFLYKFDCGLDEWGIVLLLAVGATRIFCSVNCTDSLWGRQRSGEWVPANCTITDTSVFWTYEVNLLTKIPSAWKICPVNLVNTIGHVMHQQFNIQQLYALSHTLYLCVL
jgi:hypothetical protein